MWAMPGAARFEGIAVDQDDDRVLRRKRLQVRPQGSAVKFRALGSDINDHMGHGLPRNIRCCNLACPTRHAGDPCVTGP